MNGGELLVNILRARGVDHVAVLCGNGLNAFMQACMDGGIRIVDVRNEQAASYMADTWGAMTGRLGVVAVSAGPGHTNAITGLTNAWWDGRPMLLISGCSEAETRGLGHFQELDQIALVEPVTKYASLVERADQLEFEADKAIQIALSGRPGPVHLTVTGDVMGGQVPEPFGLSGKVGLDKVSPAVAADRDLVAKAAEMLSEAKTPIIVAGSGCFYADAEAQMKAFVEATDIPLYSLMWDRCCIGGAWPQYVGPTTSECNGAFALVAEADVVLVLGGRVDFRLGYGRPPVCSPDARFIRVDVDADEIAHGQATLPIVADPRSFLSALLEVMPEESNAEWLSRVVEARAQFVNEWDDKLCQLETPLPAMCVVRAIKPFLDRDITFLLDGGNIGRWAHMMLWDRHPGFWHTCGLSGVVGWGIPGAIGAKLARPQKPLLLLSGDGSAGFTLGDIETAVRHETPFVVVVASDAAWGIVAECFDEDCRCGSKLGDIRFDKVAEALGARGVYIDHGSQLSPAIEEALSMNTVTVIHVPLMLGGIDYWRKRLG